jgi:hypothetical protein
MRRRFLFGAFLATFLFIMPAVGVNASAKAPASTAGSLASFPTEAAAQAHCPADEVVWLNTISGIYHVKGMRWYGKTKYGAYVCRKEADAAGDRDTRNGQ